MKMVRTQGRILVSALPQESVTANMARRVLKLIREEYDALQAVSSSYMNGMLSSCTKNSISYITDSN